jgi:hypothetical protein
MEYNNVGVLIFIQNIDSWRRFVLEKNYNTRLKSGIEGNRANTRNVH